MKRPSLEGRVVDDSSRPRLVVVGPLPIAADVVGGTKVSFAVLVDVLRSHGRFRLEVLNSSRPLRTRHAMAKAWLNLVALLSLTARLWRATGKAEAVLWNVSPRGAILAAPLLRGVCRLRGLPLVVRLFGGDFGSVYGGSSPPVRLLADRWLLSADLVLMQTRELVEEFSRSATVKWFPTSRDMRPRKSPLVSQCRRFLFLGHLRMSRGISELLTACARLPETADLTIAGPPVNGFDIRVLEKRARVNYVGPVESHDIPDFLERHDVLVFPTYYDGEGYPGVVIEAFQLGLPVIATHWKALPELITAEENGLLVPPRDSSALGRAMRRLYLDDSLFSMLQRGALERGETFRSERVVRQLESWMDAVIRES